MTALPRRMMPSETVLRGLQKGWVNPEGYVQRIAYMRRPLIPKTQEPEEALSTYVEASCDAQHACSTYRKSAKSRQSAPGVARLVVEDVDVAPRRLLSVRQDSTQHASILGMPLESEDGELALNLAVYLASNSVFVQYDVSASESGT